MDKKLAVVIPAYKSTFLRATLDSLARQSNREFTVYIGDDASPNDLVSIINDYKDKISIVYRRFTENMGKRDLTAHWTRCINMSKESVIWLFSDDDLMPSDAVQRIHDAVEDYGEDNIMFRFPLAVVNASGEIKRENPPSETEYISGAEFLLEKLSGRINSAACEYVFSRKVWMQAGGFVKFPLAWCSDDATWAKFADCTKGIVTLSGSPVCWRNAEGENISNSDCYDKEKLKATAMFLDWMGARYPSYLRDKMFQRAIAKYVKTILHTSVHSHYSSRDLWAICSSIGRYNMFLALRIAIRHMGKGRS